MELLQLVNNDGRQQAACIANLKPQNPNNGAQYNDTQRQDAPDLNAQGRLQMYECPCSNVTFFDVCTMRAVVSTDLQQVVHIDQVSVNISNLLQVGADCCSHNQAWRVLGPVVGAKDTHNQTNACAT